MHLLNNVAASGDIDLFDHLVSRGADTSLCTALHSASRCTDVEMSKAMICHLLYKYNMDINQNNDGLRHLIHDSQDSGSPLCSAILHENLAIVHELLQRGAKVNTIAENAAYFASRPDSSYRKSEKQVERERAEEWKYQAMIALLNSAME